MLGEEIDGQKHNTASGNNIYQKDGEKSKYRNYERGIQYLLQKYIASLRREMGYPHKLQIRSEFR